MKLAILDKDHFIIDKVSSEEKIEGSVDLIKYPLDLNLVRAKWSHKKKQWEEGATEEELQEALNPRKEVFLKNINREAEDRINEFLSVYDQLELIRAGDLEDPRFKRRDTIVSKCREVKKLIEKGRSVDEIKEAIRSLPLSEE